jgi:hypothetical protein
MKQELITKLFQRFEDACYLYEKNERGSIESIIGCGNATSHNQGI